MKRFPQILGIFLPVQFYKLLIAFIHSKLFSGFSIIYDMGSASFHITCGIPAITQIISEIVFKCLAGAKKNCAAVMGSWYHQRNCARLDACSAVPAKPKTQQNSIILTIFSY